VKMIFTFSIFLSLLVSRLRTPIESSCPSHIFISFYILEFQFFNSRFYFCSDFESSSLYLVSLWISSTHLQFNIGSPIIHFNFGESRLEFVNQSIPFKCCWMSSLTAFQLPSSPQAFGNHFYSESRDGFDILRISISPGYFWIGMVPKDSFDFSYYSLFCFFYFGFRVYLPFYFDPNSLFYSTLLLHYCHFWFPVYYDSFFNLPSFSFSFSFRAKIVLSNYCCSLKHFDLDRFYLTIILLPSVPRMSRRLVRSYRPLAPV
jgi:hypothetical protein